MFSIVPTLQIESMFNIDTVPTYVVTSNQFFFSNYYCCLHVCVCVKIVPDVDIGAF